MFDEAMFREAIKNSGKTLQDIADLLNINLTTLYRKMNGESDFYRSEMEILQKTLKLKNAEKIFLQNNLLKRKKRGVKMIRIGAEFEVDNKRYIIVVNFSLKHTDVLVSN